GDGLQIRDVGGIAYIEWLEAGTVGDDEPTLRHDGLRFAPGIDLEKRINADDEIKLVGGEVALALEAADGVDGVVRRALGLSGVFDAREFEVGILLERELEHGIAIVVWSDGLDLFVRRNVGGDKDDV